MDLEKSLRKILDDYEGQIKDEMETVIKKVAQKARASLKSTSPVSTGGASMGKKHYKDQWTVRYEVERSSASAVVFQKSPTYALAHLLEHDHALRGGGRVSGKPHIKPVEETIINTIVPELRRAIE